MKLHWGSQRQEHEYLDWIIHFSWKLGNQHIGNIVSTGWFERNPPLENTLCCFKVTVYLQGCLVYKRCSVSGLNCRYLNPYIRLKLLGLAIRLYQNFKKMNCRIFHNFWIREPKSPFERYMSKKILFFTWSTCSSVSGAKALKKVSVISHVQFQWEVAQHFWNRIKKIWSDRKKIDLEKKVFRNKKFADTFLFFIC